MAPLKHFLQLRIFQEKEGPFQIKKPKSLISYLKYVRFAQFLDFCCSTVILQISTFTNKNNV